MDAFIGEIRILPYTFAPMDWALCNGMSFPVSQNQALYSIIGNLYGGTPNQTFFLPNLQGTGAPGAAPLGAGNGPGLTPRVLQQPSIGAPAVTLTVAQIPQHNHILTEQNAGVATDIIDDPTNNFICHGETSGTTPFSTFAVYNAATRVPLKNSLSPAGNGQAHENRHPFLPMNFCICLNGIYPIRP